MGAVFQPASLATLEKVNQEKSVMWSSLCILPKRISLVDMSLNLLRPASCHPSWCQKPRQVFPLWSYP